MHKENCQFAHGIEDLRSSGQSGKDFGGGNNNMNNMLKPNQQNNNMNKKTPNPQNYKIVKCVNFEQCM